MMVSWLYVCHFVIIRQSDGHLVVCMLFCYNKTQSDGHRWKWWEDKIYMWNKLSILIVYKIQAFLVLGVIIHIKLGVICLAHTWVDNGFISHISVTMTMTKINFQKKELILVYGFKGRVANSSRSMAASYCSKQPRGHISTESMKQRSYRRLWTLKTHSQWHMCPRKAVLLHNILQKTAPTGDQVFARLHLWGALTPQRPVLKSCFEQR